MWVVSALRALAKPMRLTSRSPFRIMALALSWIHFVVLVSAGPPLGGLYLNPPSSGGLWEGEITTPSARPVSRCLL